MNNSYMRGEDAYSFNDGNSMRQSTVGQIPQGREHSTKVYKKHKSQNNANQLLPIDQAYEQWARFENFL